MGGDTPRIVVTGGAGFIGAHLCRELVTRGVTVAVVDDLSTGQPGQSRRARRGPAGGVGDRRGLLAEVCAGAHSVVHLAGLASVSVSVDRPEQVHEVNATGTLRVLRAAAGGHVVLAWLSGTIRVGSKSRSIVVS